MRAPRRPRFQKCARARRSKLSTQMPSTAEWWDQRHSRCLEARKLGRAVGDQSNDPRHLSTFQMRWSLRWCHPRAFCIGQWGECGWSRSRTRCILPPQRGEHERGSPCAIVTPGPTQWRECLRRRGWSATRRDSCAGSTWHLVASVQMWVSCASLSMLTFRPVYLCRCAWRQLGSGL